MKKNTLSDSLNQKEKYYSTQTLAKLLRVGESTIKQWSESGKLKYLKTSGGVVRFSPQHISEFIANYDYDLIPSEMDISSHDRNDLIETLIRTGDFGTLSEVYFSQAVKGEKKNLFIILRECHKENISLLTIYDDIVLPAIKRLKRLRFQGKLSPAEERITANTLIENIIQFQARFQTPFITGKKALFFLKGSGIEEVGLICAKHLLEMAGWKVLNLIPLTQFEMVTETIKKVSPDLVCAGNDILVNNTLPENLTSEIKNIAIPTRFQLLIACFDSKEAVSIVSGIEQFSVRSFSSFKGLLEILSVG